MPQTFSVAEPDRILADIVASNGMPPQAELDALRPTDFATGWRRLLAHAAKTAQYTGHELLAMLSPAERLALFPTDAAAGEPRYATWDDLAQVLASIEWDWPGWLARGFLTMIAASQEMGKSILALRIAGCYAMGWDWPDGSPYTGETGSVVWAEGEAGQQLNIARAKAWGLDLSRIVTPHEELDDFRFENEEHRDHLWHLMAQPHVKLGIIDSLSGIHLGKESDAEMQRIILPFAELTRDTSKVLILNHHLNKPPHGQTDVLTLARVRGSGTITQTARIVWGIDKPDPHQPDTRRIKMLKTNLGAKPDPLGFTIDAAGITFCEAPEEARKETQVDRAADMLLGLLAKGPMRQPDVKERTLAAGISWRSTRRAKDRLKIVPKKESDGWYWSLPARDVK